MCFPKWTHQVLRTEWNTKVSTPLALQQPLQWNPPAKTKTSLCISRGQVNSWLVHTNTKHHFWLQVCSGCYAAKPHSRLIYKCKVNRMPCHTGSYTVAIISTLKAGGLLYIHSQQFLCSLKGLLPGNLPSALQNFCLPWSCSISHNTSNESNLAFTMFWVP